jgi:hypothetical protein
MPLRHALCRLLLGLLLAAPVLAAPARAADDGFARKPAPREFHGLAFGAEIKDLGLTPVPGQKDTFYRKDEVLTLGRAKLVSVAYYARKGRLAGVGLAVKGEANIFLAQDALIQSFGPGEQRGPHYGWVWPDFSLVLTRKDKDTAAIYYTLETDR